MLTTPSMPMLTLGQLFRLRLWGWALVACLLALPARAAIYASSTSNITANSATLNAVISGSLLGAESFYFQIGTSTSYGRNISAARTFLLSGLFGYFGVETQVASLSCSTTYNWRLVQKNYLLGVIYTGSTYGPNQTFTTTACAPVAMAPGAFTVFESAVSNSAAASSANRVIQTRVAGLAGGLCSASGSCGLKVAALNNGTLNTAYNGTVTASLEACTNVSRSNGLVACGGTWAAIAGASLPVVMAAGTGLVSFATVAEAYEMVRVKLVSTSPALTAYGEDYFAIRPASLLLGATDGSDSTQGTARSLSNGQNTHRAARPFTLSAQALTTTGALSGNYPGSAPGPVLQSLSNVSPTGGADGTLTLGAWAASASAAKTLLSVATYDEVGNFSLSLQDQNFADVDAADTPAAQRYFSGSLAQVGRFTPDHFTTEVTPACSAGGFTYSGQPFALKVIARNANGEVTVNYTGSHAYAHSLSVPLTPSVPAGNGSLTHVSLSAAQFTAGVASTNTPTYTFTKPTTQPTTITVRSVDTQGISSSGQQEGSTAVRSGRVAMKNAFGSEMLALPVALSLETYNNGWVPHTADTCSSLSASNFAWAPGSSTAANPNNWQACESALSLQGSPPNYQMRMSAPGAGNQGWADVTLLLGTSGTGGACTRLGAGFSGAAVPALMPWLQFNWTGSVGNPTARVSFGKYNNRLIYMRENF